MSRAGHIAAQTRVRGLTLIELMLAIALGSLVMLAVVTLYINVNRSHVQDERYALMQENGHYALKQIANDLLMAAFWGRMVAIDAADAPDFAASGACATAAGLNLFTGNQAIFSNSYHGTSAVEQFTAADCTLLNSNRVPKTDILVVKRVANTPTAQRFIDYADTNGNSNTTEEITEGVADLVNGVVYLRTNGVNGGFVNNVAGTAPALGESYWRYVPHVYFIRDFFRTAGDGIPALCRLELVGTGLGQASAAPAGTADTAAQCIAGGIEDLRIDYGIDTDDPPDGVPDQYLIEPTTAQMAQVISARIYLLARSTQPVPFYTNEKSYTLGTRTYATPPVGSPNYANDPPWPANDAFYRRVYSTTVKVRNSVSTHLLNF